MTDARKLLSTRAIRGLADGVVSVALASHLTSLGFTPLLDQGTFWGRVLDGSERFAVHFDRD